VSEIMILGVNGKYIPLNPEKIYQIAVNSFLANGGDNHFIFKNRKKMSTYITMRSIVKNSLSTMSQISPGTENRINYK
jgi:hypothetical protein